MFFTVGIAPSHAPPPIPPSPQKDAIGFWTKKKP